jgi:15-cis-phytoene synthase
MPAMTLAPEGSLTPELSASYRASEAVARSRARNFYFSFVVLPVWKRRAFCAMYAFMRECDDISDGPGSVEEKKALLNSWRRRMDAALRGDTAGNPIWPAFHDAVRRFSIPREYFHWIVDGAEMDLGIDRYRTFDELYQYCFRVASAVGLVCLHIYGFSGKEAEQYAEQCGIALQLTNIIRDVKEDASLGRIYLPLEDLDRFGYRPEELLTGVADERFTKLLAFEAERAEQYYRRGMRLLPLVARDSQPALWAILEIYHRLLHRIVGGGYRVFDGRVRLPAVVKAGIAGRALAMRWLPRLARPAY